MTPVHSDATLRIDPFVGEGMSTAVTADLSEPQPLHCYRHPERETFVRCGRCDQPICMGCAMQGPVGLRCKTCGKPSRDALESMRPSQVAIGFLVAGGVAAAVGYFGTQLGWFMVVVGFFAGTLIAEALDRTVGIKRGPLIAVTGILVGGSLGASLSVLGMWREMAAFVSAAGSDGVPIPPLDAFLLQYVPNVLITLAATIVGAYARRRRICARACGPAPRAAEALGDCQSAPAASMILAGSFRRPTVTAGHRPDGQRRVAAPSGSPC